MKKNPKDSLKPNPVTVIMTTIAALATLGILIFTALDYMQQRIPMYEMQVDMDYTRPIYYEEEYNKDSDALYQNNIVTEEEMKLMKPQTSVRFELLGEKRIPIWIKVTFTNIGRKLFSIEFIKVWNLVKMQSKDAYIVDHLWGIYENDYKKVIPPFIIHPGHQQTYFLKIAFVLSEEEYKAVQKILLQKSTDTFSLLAALWAANSGAEGKRNPRKITADDLREKLGRYIEIHAKIAGEKQIILRSIPAGMTTIE